MLRNAAGPLRAVLQRLSPPLRSSSAAGSFQVRDDGELLDGRADEGVIGPSASLLALEQARVVQLLQMVRDRRLRQAERPLEVAAADRLVARRDQVDDPNARRIAEGAEDRRRRLGLLVAEGRGGKRRTTGDGLGRLRHQMPNRAETARS